MIEIKGKYSKAKVMVDDVEEGVMLQITKFLNHPAFTNDVAIMPDTHVGIGSVIGFTMKMTGKVIPNVIGVDIGCGVVAANFATNIYENITPERLDGLIRNNIPFGHNIHSKDAKQVKRNFENFPWHTARSLANSFAIKYQEEFGVKLPVPKYQKHWFEKKCLEIGIAPSYAVSSLGTLGGGNHFIEIGKSDISGHWVTIHSGSRNLGLKICNYWQNLAKHNHKTVEKEKLKEQIKDIKERFDSYNIEIEVQKAKAARKVSSELTFLTGDSAANYLFDMIFAQVYAAYNRKIILKVIKNILELEPKTVIETTHNYIDFADFIIRKGAVASYEDNLIIIPFNMRDGILLCEGKSNKEWNFSAPHGAGRCLSRSQARAKLSLEDFKEAMKEIYSNSVGYNTIDEAPDAYKDANLIETLITPTAKIKDKIVPVQNLKDSGKKKYRR